MQLKLMGSMKIKNMNVKDERTGISYSQRFRVTLLSK